MSDRFARISAFYDDLVERHGHVPRACDYGSPDSQRAKFKVLSEVADLAGMRALDVGCGFADFARYLRPRFSSVEYVGVDVSRRMIEEGRRLEPALDLRLGNIMDMAFTETFDLVTANGIFYLLGEDAPRLMHEMIQRMFALARVAVAFNSLSTWARDPEPQEFHADPLEVLAFCRELTPWCVLRHDYHPRDFTIYLYKRGGA